MLHYHERSCQMKASGICGPMGSELTSAKPPAAQRRHLSRRKVIQDLVDFCLQGCRACAKHVSTHKLSKSNSITSCRSSCNPHAGISVMQCIGIRIQAQRLGHQSSQNCRGFPKAVFSRPYRRGPPIFGIRRFCYEESSLAQERHLTIVKPASWLCQLTPR